MKRHYTTGNLNGKAVQFRSITTMFLVVMAILFSANGLLARDSELSIEKWNNGSFIVELDHERYRAKGEFYMDGLEEGKHRLRILQPQINIKTGTKRMKVVYNGFIDIPENSRTEALVKRGLKFEITKQVQLAKPEPVICHDHHYDSDEYYIDDDGVTIEEEEVIVETCPEEHIPVTVPGDCGTTTEEEVFFETELIMNEHDFEDLIEILENEWFDSSKLSTAKQALRSNTMSAEQVKRLVETLTFESSRLDLAKFAYEYTLDKENYYLIFTALNYSSSVNELELWITERS